MAKLSDYIEHSPCISMKDHVTARMVKDGVIRCNKEATSPGGNHWTCTRQKGHTGKHEAGVDDMVAYASWDLN